MTCCFSKRINLLWICGTDIKSIQFSSLQLFIFVYLGNNRTADNQFDFINKQILVVPVTCVTFTRVGGKRTCG